MRVHHETIRIPTRGQGTYEATGLVGEALRNSGMASGLLTVFCPHTSCSLVMMENASPEARRDLGAFLCRLVPEDRRYEHSIEGGDDMPAHIKMALTRTSESIPFSGGALLLGTWQGIYLWEHRSSPHERSLVVTAMGT
ncbi:MAG TPA: secondary thiamine-phosphate synthase enzyme YjbQ [Opitutaceae bacterium]